MSKPKLPLHLQDWGEARKRFRFSHAHVQMAREHGTNPRKLGKLANHDQEPWKAPLPLFLERIYFKRFKRERPESVMSIEERAHVGREEGGSEGSERSEAPGPRGGCAKCRR